MARHGVALLAALAVAGCTNMASPNLPSFDFFAAKVPFVVPAKSSATAAIVSVSVVPVGNPMSTSIAREVEGKMVGLKFNEQPFYTKVALHDFVPVAVLTPQNFATIAAQDQTGGVISIAYAGQRIDRRNYQESRSECTNRKGLFGCEKNATRTFQVSCEERSATVSAELRAYDARLKKVVYSDTVSEKAVVARCSDATDAQLSDNDLVGNAVVAVQGKIQAAIAPSVQLRALDLMEPDLAVGATPAQEQFQAALKFARAKRLDEACQRFVDLYDSNKESTALTYNVGFCDEARGDLVNAAARYRRASELARGPNSQIDRNLMAVERQIKEVGLVALPALAQERGDAGGALAGIGRRVALVVGNARYDKTALVNPVNDARLVQAQLRKLGFEVTEVENVNSGRFQSLVADFSNKARGAEVALFYYAGHAVQIDGDNLLLPTDNVGFATNDDIRDKAVSLTMLLAQLDSAAPRVKLVVLDACRDDPLRLPEATRSMAGGLAAVREPSAGTLIAFATSAGQTAPDGKGKNSVFTKHFVKGLQKPNQKVEDLFKQVRADVQRETNNKQKPTEVSSLTGDFYFRPVQAK